MKNQRARAGSCDRNFDVGESKQSKITTLMERVQITARAGGECFCFNFLQLRFSFESHFPTVLLRFNKKGALSLQERNGSVMR